MRASIGATTRACGFLIAFTALGCHLSHHGPSPALSATDSRAHAGPSAAAPTPRASAVQATPIPSAVGTHAPAAPPSPPSAPAPIASLTRSLAGGPACRLGSPHAFGSLDQPATLALGAAAGPVALAAATSDASHVKVWVLHPDGTPAGGAVSVEMPEAGHLFAVQGLGADHFLLVTKAACDAKSDDPCLHLRWLGRDGSPVGPPATDKLYGPIRDFRFIEHDGALDLYAAFHDNQPLVVRFDLGPGGSVQKSTNLLSIENDVTFYSHGAFLVQGASPPGVVVYTDGNDDSGAVDVVFAGASSGDHLESLSPQAAIQAAVADGDGLAVVYGPRPSARQVARFESERYVPRRGDPARRP